jgi:hypothetical protein
MPVLGTLPTEKSKLVALYVNENSRYQTNLSRLDLAKRIIQDPNESPERRAEFKVKYEKYKKDVETSRLNRRKLQEAVDKLEGGKELTKINEDVADLLEAKSLIIEPNDPDIARIDAKIEKLVKPFQDAYSKTIGARISETVARAKLVKKEIPTFNETEAVAGTLTTPTTTLSTTPEKKATPSLITPATPKAPEKKKTPKPAGFTPKATIVTQSGEEIVVDSKGRAADGRVPVGTTKPGSMIPKDTGAVTINPATGEEIKVSSIQPERPSTARQEAAATIAAGADFGLSEALFKNVPSLKAIFDEYVNPKSGMTDDEFRKRIRNDVWFKKNSGEIKTRFVQYYNYRDLQESGQADGSTDYEQQISRIERTLAKRAVEIGSAAASDPVALRKAAENLYITNREDDTTYVDDFLASSIRPVSGMIGGQVTEGYSGAALQNYNALLRVARDNGFQISDILPGGANEQQVLAGIASGKIDINRVAQDARKIAAQGQPQYVRDLLSQGYNLKDVFAPYRQTMANILEIGDPDQIDLNDPTLRMAITDKGDMNIYDFKKALKQDNRWQYTENARNEVSTAALNVLRDFGFQG